MDPTEYNQNSADLTSNDQPQTPQPIPSQEPVQNPQPAEQRSTYSALAIVGFVLALFSLLVDVFLSFLIPLIIGLIAAIICIVALLSLSKNPGMKGKGMAITGIVIGIIQIVMIGLATLYFASTDDIISEKLNSPTDDIFADKFNTPEGRACDQACQDAYGVDRTGISFVFGEDWTCKCGSKGNAYITPEDMENFINKE